MKFLKSRPVIAASIGRMMALAPRRPVAVYLISVFIVLPALVIVLVGVL